MDESDLTKLPALAYLNKEFLKSPDARIIRMVSEYLEPAARLRRHGVRDTIVFFGSARSVTLEQATVEVERARSNLAEALEPTRELQAELSRAEYAVKLARYYEDAVELARRLTEWSKGLTGNRHFIICSGGSAGMMEAANRGASLAHGRTIGLNIELPHEQAVNRFVSHDLVFNFHYFFMRKFWFVYPAKALVIFPGGFGTMDELFEVVTLIQTKMPRKVMPVVLYGSEFWDQVLNLDALVRWGVISAKELDIIYRSDSVDDAFTYLTTRLEALYLTPRGLEEIVLT
jgi:uncharacterized protein (TIGR00730 family)